MSIITRAYDLTGRTAIVTGGAGNLGVAIGTALSEAGARVVLIDKVETIADVAAGLPGIGHVGIVADLIAFNTLEPLIARIEADVGPIDILVNNAGAALIDEAEHVPVDRWDFQMDLNLKAPFLIAQAVGRRMIARGSGRIVNMASQAGVIALPGHVAYTATKAAIIGMTKALAFEWSPKGVTVNAVSPTVVNTELGRRIFDGDAGVEFRARLPTRRFAEPEEIALAVLYLACNGAGSTTGANLLVDGGYTIQ
ncbi:2-deoxy-D-gluconate 3-dehydrogenase [Sphingomonas sp. BE138]|uniref:GolD/DthD family dehydrogenase n=1 Tax=Sphingomonas sp. BE138 TaxID=2817845 RepID=UPI002857F6B3|nr:D-threitol dehydrogenase [Sphingomonas sp. BE138]MDR6788539.1 2-deoxy-D-gluconate 3-dehydrogenase [Sphingomonas sp. BE138]